MFTFLIACIIGACGGSGEVPQLASAENVAVTSEPSQLVTSRSLPASGAVVTRVQVLDIDGHAGSQSQVPVTFGQVFRPGDIPANGGVTLALADGTAIPFQVDVKARHADGSLRHAIFSTVLAQMGAGKPQTILLSRTDSVAAPTAATTPNGLLKAGFTASVNLNLGGTVYSASAD
ncbi:MAG: hypothetical protein ABI351_10930, partial [Herbaspirillum sp.]